MEATSRVGRAVEFAKATPCAVLLAVQLLAVLLYPVLEDASGPAGGVGRSVISLIGVFVLFLAVLAVRRTPALTWISWGLGVPLVVLTVAEGFFPQNQTLTLWSGFSHALFYFYTAYGMVR